VIERHITFDARPDLAAEFERFFAERYRPAMAQAPGFIRVELLREMDAPSRYHMVLRWQDVAAATGWRTSATHQGLQPALNALVSTTEITAYDVVD
jgi:heme-degrading monooxygenase HmoA